VYEKAGHFGFFEVVEDYTVAESLLNTAVDWIKERGLNKIMGPTNYSTNETCGTLIDGFDTPPTLMMPYNPPYYDKYLQQYGLIKDMDLLSYMIYTKDLHG